MKRHILLATMVMGFATAGCVHTGFTPTTGLALPARPPNCYLDLIFQGRPAYPYVVLGQVTTDSTAPGLFALGESNDVAIQRMKEEACAVGAHGMMNVGANSQGVWDGNGYSKSTSGGAVAFIYVDPSGQPLAPPNGPRVIIQPGAYPSPVAAAAAPPPPNAPPPPAQ
ncbi:MAG TPA: hypothetical protein VN853_03780 [Polyangia bacterium]|jgi:hypothetical protein|nr:hypothetical protein [Polyangia bacterium]